MKKKLSDLTDEKLNLGELMNAEELKDVNGGTCSSATVVCTAAYAVCEGQNSVCFTHLYGEQYRCVGGRCSSGVGEG